MQIFQVRLKLLEHLMNCTSVQAIINQSIPIENHYLKILKIAILVFVVVTKKMFSHANKKSHPCKVAKSSSYADIER